MVRRPHIGKTLVNDPELVFLNESAFGIGPAEAGGIREMVGEMENQGKTMFLQEFLDGIRVFNLGRFLLKFFEQLARNSVRRGTLRPQGVSAVHL